MVRNTVRRARRARRCSLCSARIPAGARYLESWASPHHDDLGNPSWWRLDECSACARVCGRWPEGIEEVVPCR